MTLLHVEVCGDLAVHDTLLSIEKDQTAARYRPAYGWRDAGTS
jgi:hypothetical protein